MHLDIAADPGETARHAAAHIAGLVRAAVAERGRAALALSGGSTPWRMLDHLAALELPWHALQVFQVDERVAPAGDAARNISEIERRLVEQGQLPAGNLLAMPVERPDLSLAARDYGALLSSHLGQPPLLDIVQLGLGTDGHTASLVPGDEALEVLEADVAVTAPYAGHRRMTLTFPAINRARAILWLVTGVAKATMLAGLVAGGGGTPAARIGRERATIFADAAAGSGLTLS